MKGRNWVLVFLALFLFLGASFFFFIGSFFCLLPQYAQKGNVAVIEVLGGIFDAKPIIDDLRDLKKNDLVKAVVLRVDSPGGSVSASQEIYEAIRELKKTKPVVVSMGAVAASGGYYVALSANRILAQEGTITGSIGVRMELLNVEELLHWAKVKPMTLKSGSFKDIGSATRPMTEEEKQYLESILKELHQQFKKAVQSNRSLTVEEVNNLTEGQIFTGQQALEKKLVDEIGSLDRAVEVGLELAGVKEEPQVFYPSESKGRWFDLLMESAVQKFIGIFFRLKTTPFYL